MSAAGGSHAAALLLPLPLLLLLLCLMPPGLSFLLLAIDVCWALELGAHALMEGMQLAAHRQRVTTMEALEVAPPLRE